MIPYFFLQIRKRALRSLAAVGICAAVAFAFCRTARSGAQMESRIQAIKEKIFVRCAVSNATGNQTRDLEIPKYLLQLFLPEDGAESEFTPYIRDVHVDIRLNAYGPKGSTELHGITSLAAAPSLPNLQWLPGYSEELLSGDGMYVIMPEEVKLEGETVELSFSKRPQEIMATPGVFSEEFTVVATYGGNLFYCAYTTGETLSQKFWYTVTASSISATLVDNTKIEEFWQTAARRYFAEPVSDPVSERALALVIYDDALEEAMATLRQNRLFLDMALAGLVAVAFGVGLVFSFLCLRSQARELWLQYILGIHRVRIFLAALLEQGLLSLAGVGLGVGLCALLERGWPDLSHQGLFLGVYLLGTVLAYFATMRKRFLATGVGGE